MGHLLVGIFTAKPLRAQRGAKKMENDRAKPEGEVTGQPGGLIHNDKTHQGYSLRPFATFAALR
jgi:hypothetical protein